MEAVWNKVSQWYDLLVGREVRTWQVPMDYSIERVATVHQTVSGKSTKPIGKPGQMGQSQEIILMGDKVLVWQVDSRWFPKWIASEVIGEIKDHFGGDEHFCWG
eukprot:11012280-Ditylum_brightwellii.AAC.1